MTKDFDVEDSRLRFRVDTTVRERSKIVQTILYNGRVAVGRFVLDVREPQVRRALISLGWKPPDEAAAELADEYPSRGAIASHLLKVVNESKTEYRDNRFAERVAVLMTRCDFDQLLWIVETAALPTATATAQTEEAGQG